MIQSTFTKAIKEYFGFRPGQNPIDFITELKALTDEDRAYFKREFAKIGIEIVS